MSRWCCFTPICFAWTEKKAVGEGINVFYLWLLNTTYWHKKSHSTNLDHLLLNKYWHFSYSTWSGNYYHHVFLFIQKALYSHYSKKQHIWTAQADNWRSLLWALWCNENHWIHTFKKHQLPLSRHIYLIFDSTFSSPTPKEVPGEPRWGSLNSHGKVAQFPMPLH